MGREAKAKIINGNFRGEMQRPQIYNFNNNEPRANYHDQLQSNQVKRTPQDYINELII